MKTSRYRIGLIGPGLIAASHVPALRAAGLDVAAVSSRPGSARVRDFAARHEIAQVYDDWQSMLRAKDQWDALVITTWPDGTPAILEAALELGVPILVEKPVAWNSASLRRLCALPHSQVLVGYNRRFYPVVHRARTEVQNGPPLLAQLTLPGDVKIPAQHDPTLHYMQSFFESVSAHSLDATRLIMGDLRVDTVKRLHTASGNLYGLAALLTTERGDLIQLTCNWDTPANYALTLHRPGRRFELLPFEIGSVYEGMQVQPISEEYPIRRYTPTLVERINLEGVDLELKPGFGDQSLALKAMIDGQELPPYTARLEDALAVTTLCEELTGVVLNDSNPNHE